MAVEENNTSVRPFIQENTKSSAQENKAVVRRFIEEAWNKGNLDVADELVDPEFCRSDASNPELRGPEALKRFVTSYRNIFPDTHITIEDQIAEGDKVVTRYTVTSSRRGEYAGGTFTGISIYRVADGKIVERWGEGAPSVKQAL